MLLERFRKGKQAEVEALRLLADAGNMPAPLEGQRPDFLAALRGESGAAVNIQGQPLAVVAEYKRASPSRGVICESLEVEDVARQYAVSGADCLSILTEEAHFRGCLGYLARAADPGLYESARPPLLRKDFIFDTLQVAATAATPASALLLIVRLTPDAMVLRLLREQAESHGMHAVVEVFDQEDLLLARESGARIIQVNARDLETLVTDREAALALARACPPQKGEVWIAASGIDRGEHLRAVAQAGFNAALVGSALMQWGQPGQALAELLAQAVSTGSGEHKKSETAGEGGGHAH
ncbi:MAG: indole-3-glycerol-phosphate synthase [Desulfovibrio sp.]|nr:indole-3-glycerol-phosphate synthase [Desulfovibrio sp.]